MEARILTEQKFLEYTKKSWNKDEYYILMNNNEIIEQSVCCSEICEVCWNSSCDATHVVIISKD